MEANALEPLEAMMVHADEVFFIYDTDDAAFTYVNDAFEALTEVKKDELMQRPKQLLKMVHKEDLAYVKHSLGLLPEKKTKSLLDFRFHRPDETERWVRVKVYPVEEDGKIRYLTGLGEDDTARKASIFNMQKINGWKDANLEIMSHDLRGPIGIVKMLSSVISRKLPDNKDIHKLTNMIEEISQRNIALIQNVLANESLDTAELEVSKERLDVVWEIHQALDIYIESQHDIKKKITFTHSRQHIYASVDSMKFLQVINNLVSNAIKFTKDNGIIKVHAELLEKSFLITVSDDGIGIPKNLQPILFKKYTRAGRTGVEGEESVGLGMWIVKTLTDAHQGRVWFESAAQKGSTFYVEIPLGFD